MSEITNVDRMRAVGRGFYKAEERCGLLLVNAGKPMGERAQAIIDNAFRSGLEPRLYAMAWFIKQHFSSEGISDA